jgi:hypothetical protein
MLIIEHFVASKQPGRLSEDMIVTADHWAAVVDGATDASGTRFDGVSGGRFAAEVIAAALLGLDPDLDARTAIDALTHALASATARVAEADDAVRWPSAAVTIVSPAHRQIWRVGDGPILMDGTEVASRSSFDDAAYSFRATINAALLASGRSLDDIVATDPGRAASRPLHDLQQHLANTTGQWSYGCINGRPVPDEHIEVFDLPAHEVEIIIASDGYHNVQATLTASESLLGEQQARDPAAIGELWRMGKALTPGNDSMDDRAYIRIRL